MVSHTGCASLKRSSYAKKHRDFPNADEDNPGITNKQMVNTAMLKECFFRSTLSKLRTSRNAAPPSPRDIPSVSRLSPPVFKSGAASDNDLKCFMIVRPAFQLALRRGTPQCKVLCARDDKCLPPLGAGSSPEPEPVRAEIGRMALNARTISEDAIRFGIDACFLRRTSLAESIPSHQRKCIHNRTQQADPTATTTGLYPWQCWGRQPCHFAFR
jgi:hypothetical protein